jgi:hypothetical protein
VASTDRFPDPHLDTSESITRACAGARILEMHDDAFVVDPAARPRAVAPPGELHHRGAPH